MGEGREGGGRGKKGKGKRRGGKGKGRKGGEDKQNIPHEKPVAYM